MSRLVVLSSKPPDELRRLLDHLQREVLDARVCGVLYEKRPPGTAAQRIRALFRKLPQPGYLRYATREAFRRILFCLAIPIDATIRLLHACPRKPNPPAKITLRALSHQLQRRGCELFVTPDAQSSAALAFVERQEADLGVVFGPGLLNPALVKIPRLGSIGLNLRQVSEHQGGGLAGLWEPPDTGSEVTIAVRKIDEAPDEQPILHQATIPIERYDDLKSLAFKAEVVGNDLVVAAIADCFAGEPLHCGKSKNPNRGAIRRYNRGGPTRGNSSNGGHATRRNAPGLCGSSWAVRFFFCLSLWSETGPIDGARRFPSSFSTTTSSPIGLTISVLRPRLLHARLPFSGSSIESPALNRPCKCCRAAVCRYPPWC